MAIRWPNLLSSIQRHRCANGTARTAWHDLARASRISGYIGETAGTSKPPVHRRDAVNRPYRKGLKTASQAAAEMDSSFRPIIRQAAKSRDAGSRRILLDHCGAMPLDRRGLAIPGLRLSTELGPFHHQRAALLEEVAAPIGGLNLVLDRVRQGHLDDLAGMVRALGCPVAEGGTEAMRGEVR